MDNPKKEKWYQLWWVQLAFTIFGGALSSAIYDSYKDKPILSTLVELVTFSWKLITYPIQIQFQTGWLLLAILALAVLGMFVHARNKNIRRSLAEANHKLNLIEQEKTKIPPPPEYKDYVQDRFKLWTWKWQWMYNQQMKKWHVVQLTPYCPLCDIELMNKAGRYQLAVCPKCNAQFGYVRELEAEDINAVYLLIEDKVKKKTYKVNK